jgi:hypothetical protein
MDEKLFTAMILHPMAAYHEAGHVVIALAFGEKVEEVWIRDGTGCTTLLEAGHLDPFSPIVRGNPSQVRADLRRGMAFTSAGFLAPHLAEQMEWFLRWPTPKQLREETEEWDMHSDTLLSRRYLAGERPGDPDDDLCRVMQAACLLAVGPVAKMAAAQVDGQRRLSKKTINQVNKQLQEELEKGILSEILKAERRAERLLKKHWQAVCDIANELRRKKSGRLNHKQLMELVGHHFAVTT